MTCVHRYLLDYCILIRNCRNRSVHTNNAFCIVLATQLGLLLTLVARCRITPHDGKFMFVQTDLLRQKKYINYKLWVPWRTLCIQRNPKCGPVLQRYTWKTDGSKCVTSFSFNLTYIHKPWRDSISGLTCYLQSPQSPKMPIPEKKELDAFRKYIKYQVIGSVEEWCVNKVWANDPGFAPPSSGKL
jgi:hypothetical protein